MPVFNISSSEVCTVNRIFFCLLRFYIVFIDVLTDIRDQIGGEVEGLSVKDHQCDIHFRILQKRRNFLQGCIQRPVPGKTVYTGGDQRKGDAAAVQLPRQEKGLSIAGGQLIIFLMVTPLPDRPHCMNDKSGLQTESGSDCSFSRPERADLFSLGKKIFCSGGFVYGRICSAPVNRIGICGIHDRVCMDLSDIISYDLKRHGCYLLSAG